MPKGVRRGSHVHGKHNTTTNQCVCKRFITTTAYWNAVMMIKFVINSNCAQPDMNAYKRVCKRLHHHWHLVCRKVYILHILHHSNVHHKLHHHLHHLLCNLLWILGDLYIINTVNSTEMSNKTCTVVHISVNMNRGGQSFCDYLMSMMLSIACSALCKWSFSV